VTKLLHLLTLADESDVYLTAGVSSLFVGFFLIYPPAAMIILGLVFAGIAHLTAQKEAHKEAMNGTP
jgi:hypothetical protein